MIFTLQNDRVMFTFHSQQSLPNKSFGSRKFLIVSLERIKCHWFQSFFPFGLTYHRSGGHEFILHIKSFICTLCFSKLKLL